MYGYEIFHESIMEKLIDNARQNKNANTYIFEGAKGLCRHNAARLFAQSLVCENTDNAPCTTCAACVEAKARTHPDIIYVTPEKDKATLGIKPIRAMIAESLIKPFYKKHKVFIIDDGDILTPEAQNAFLKVIEEPPEYAIFIIVCTNSELLLQTVRSRSVIITFNAVSDDIVRKYITEKYPDEPRIEFLVKFCSGIPKAADNIIDNEEFESLRDEALSLTPKFLTSNKLHAYDVAAAFDKNKSDAQLIYDMILMYIRDALVTSMGTPELVINTDKREKIDILAQTYRPELLSCAIDELILSKKMLSRYVKASATALHAALKII